MAENTSSLKKLNDLFKKTLKIDKKDDIILSDDMKSYEDILRNVNIAGKTSEVTNALEFFNSLSSSESLKSAKTNVQGTNVDAIAKQMSNGADKFKRVVNNSEDESIVKNLLAVETDRLKSYKIYDDITFYIPQMAAALGVYTDNIISPDDFTKTSLVYKRIAINDDQAELIENNLRFLTNQYKIEAKLRRIIESYLKYGDAFVSVISINDEIKNFYKEKQKGIRKGSFAFNESTIFSMDDILSKRDKLKLVNEAKSEFMDVPDDALNTFIEESAKGTLDIVNNFIEISDSSIFLEDTLEKQALQEKLYGRGLNPKLDSDGKPKDDLNINFSGSKIKMLDPRRIVKLQIDGEILGYYYFETIDETVNAVILGQSQSVSSPTNSIYASVYQSSLSQFGKTTNASVANKDEIIFDMLFKSIGKKIDNNFITKNEKFKNFIMNYLKTAYKKNNKLNIVFFRPDEVVHFAELAEGDEYGTSIFKNIIFISRIYMAVFTSTLMQKLTRAPSKRMFYVNTGLDNDIEGQINQAIRDIKAREIKIDNFSDVEAIMKSIGQFQDYFVPVVDGQKTIEIDNITTEVPEMDNEFLEYLRKSMVSGIGIPNAWLSYTDEIQFAKTLSQENGRFLRSIVVKQIMVSERLNEMYRILYMNEFVKYDKSEKEDITKNKEKLKVKSKTKKSLSDKTINSSIDDLPYISIQLPPPSSLNLTNLSEQTGNVQTVVEYILGVYTNGIADDADVIKQEFNKLLAREFMPSVNWNSYDDVFNKAVINAKKQSYNDPIKPVQPADDSDSTSSES